MKKFGLVIISLLSLTLFGCYSRDDDGYGRNIYLNISDAVVFDNQENYVIGDTLFFELKFSRYLEEEGFSNLLDIFESTKSESFAYRFGLSKFSSFSESFENVRIDPELILSARPDDSANIGFVYSSTDVSAILNAERTEYISRVGIILVEEGRFFLDLDFINLSSGNDYEEISVGINHNITDENPLTAEFTVSEN